MAVRNAASTKAAKTTLERMRYVAALSDKPYEHEHTIEGVGTFRWKHAPAIQQAQWAEQLIKGNYGAAYPMMIFVRSLDENGKRMFNTKAELKFLMEEADFDMIMEIGNEMVTTDSKASSDKELEAAAGKL